MSDVSAAAAALSIPEDLVTRSAAARAAADGTSTDEIVAAWASGGSAPAATATAPVEEPTAVVEEAEPTATSEAVTEPEPQTAAVQPPPTQPESLQQTVVSGPAVIPVLEGRHESPVLIAGGAAALLLVALLIGFLAPALPQEGNGVYTSVVPFTQAGLDGRDVYLSEGCSSCHTQVVRPIVADVGLGPVTIADANQILGSRRYGPDLSHIGSRVESQSSLLTVLANSSSHPSYASLSDEDLESLTAYLFESK